MERQWDREIYVKARGLPWSARAGEVERKDLDVAGGEEDITHEQVKPNSEILDNLIKRKFTIQFSLEDLSVLLISLTLRHELVF